MVFKVVLFLTVLGLVNVRGDGKTCSVAEPPKDYGIDVDFSVESPTVKQRHKRNTYDPEVENGKSRAEALREYLKKIERYMPAIKENINNIENRFSLDRQYNRRLFDKVPNRAFEHNYPDTRGDAPVENPWNYHQERDFYMPRGENPDDDNGRVVEYEEGGVNQTHTPSFAQMPRPEINWRYDNEERIDPMGDFEKYENTDNTDVTSKYNPNSFPPNRDYFEHDVKHPGMANICDECGRAIQRYHFGRESGKPLVINVNSDCSSCPNFMDRYTFQARGHCRPLKYNAASQHLMESIPPFHYREMPRYYYK